MKPVFTLFIALSMLISYTTPVSADGAADKGLQIAKISKSRDLGWSDIQATMTMILKNSHGETSIRKMHIKVLEQTQDGDKSLTVFDSPNDVKGTAFLSFSHPNANDEQWLYLPALKRVKRISSRNKSGSFMGSEFAFEDLTSFEVEKYDYRYIKDEKLNGVATFVVENYPKDKYSGYKRRVTWVGKAEYRMLKIDFYDRKNTLLKTLHFNQYKQYLGKYWRAQQMVMINHQSGKSTELQWQAYRFKTGLKQSDFNRNALKRAR
ncbi:MAG TPA: outer membrane lipoprotein-sorting protein [Gammaproteobacteria bacterium]|nr:outer membrane lipoprotein-sorting protein [Gammaproteobacteria bacterium]